MSWTSPGLRPSGSKGRGLVGFHILFFWRQRCVYYLALLVRWLLSCVELVAQAKDPERPRCENCGMFTDISSTNVHATLKLDGKQGEHNFVCLGCVYEFMHDKVQRQVRS